jgi:phospholipase/carboxylesterase
LRLGRTLDRDEIAFMAPQAANDAWYPQRFLVPTRLNQPWLDSALGVVFGLIDGVLASGMPGTRLLLGGFSQGACLALEATARRGSGLGGVFAFAGGLIGAIDEPRLHDQRIDGLPVFLGCGDVDEHIPLSFVEHASRVLRALGADLTLRVYPGVNHTVVLDEVDHARALLDAASRWEE